MVAAFCGSFDPVTKGHLDVIERASRLFDHLIVFISQNSQKNTCFSFEQRLKWLEKATAHLENVECRIQEGLVVEACQKANVQVLVRGIRNETDCSYEQNMAFVNSFLDQGIETICLFTKPEYYFYSSSNVRELIKYGKDVSAFVPACVFETLQEEENE